MQQKPRLKFKAGEKVYFSNELGDFTGIVIGFVYVRSFKSLFLKKELRYEIAIQKAGDAFVSIKAILPEDRLIRSQYLKVNEDDAEIIQFNSLKEKRF